MSVTTVPKIAGADGVTAVNGITAEVTLTEGTNITITPDLNNGEIEIAASGGGTPTGTVNTVAFFDAAGDLDSTAAFGYLPAKVAVSMGTLVSATEDGALAHGRGASTGTVEATEDGAHAHGVSDGASSLIRAAGAGSVAGGSTASGGQILANLSGGPGAQAQGQASGGGQITADAIGASAFGSATTGGLVQALGTGSFGQGLADGSGSEIEASGPGSQAFGNADSGSDIISSAKGSQAHGWALNGGQITASADGAIAHGVTEAGAITASSEGSIAQGVANPGSIQAQNYGAIAMGFAENTTIIRASGFGSHAHGRTAMASSSGLALGATGTGSHAHGRTEDDGSVITASGEGASAGGHCVSNNSLITASGSGASARGRSLQASIIASGDGATALGYATNSRNLVASGLGSLASGSSDGAAALTVSGAGSQGFGSDHSVSADKAAAFGVGHLSQSFASFAVGRFATVTGTADSWVSTEPALVVGNGTSAAARANAYRVDKDGRVSTTASIRHQAIRLIQATATVNARTDYRVILDCDTVGAGVVINLPAGEDGLELVFIGTSPSGVPTGDYLLTTNGTDEFWSGFSPATPSTLGITSTQLFGMFFYQGFWYPTSI